jgi:hypothetical protein
MQTEAQNMERQPVGRNRRQPPACAGGNGVADGRKPAIQTPAVKGCMV